DDVIGTGIQIPKPPWLGRRVLGQQSEYCPVMVFLPLPSVRQDDGRVGLEDRRDGGGNGKARGRAAGDPGDLGVCSDTPLPAASGPPPPWILLSLGRPGEGRRHRSGHQVATCSFGGSASWSTRGFGHTVTMVRQPWRARVFGNEP